MGLRFLSPTPQLLPKAFLPAPFLKFPKETCFQTILGFSMGKNKQINKIHGLVRMKGFRSEDVDTQPTLPSQVLSFGQAA